MSAGHRMYSDAALLRRLLREARPCGLPLVAALAISMLATPLSLLTPLPLKIAVDHALGAHPHPLPPMLLRLLPAGVPATPARVLLLAVVLLVVTAALKQAQDLAARLLRTYVLERLTLDLRARLFLHSQRLSLAYHDRRGTGDSVYRIQKDVPDATAILIESLFPSLAAFFTLAGMLVVAARIDWTLALTALGIAPTLVVMNQHYRRTFRVRWREVKQLESSALSLTQEVLGALRVVKAYGREDDEHARFVRRSGEGMWARLRLTAIEGLYGAQVSIMTAVGTAAVLYLGIRHVQSGLITLGELLLVMGYLAQLYEPLKTLSRKAAGLQSKFAGAERVYALLDDAPDVPESPAARPLGRARGTVAFERVWFGYDDDRPVLRDVSFEIPPGSRLGIAGPTGAGKSTLVSLLQRFYDPTSGRVRLDGEDVRDVRLADLRRQFAMVLQEPVLFSTSLGENIAYARPGAGRDEVVRAARAARAHDFIARLPQGYDTVVGERGMTLSGGERQRIALARAFLKDAPVLILDEPTSAVDVRTEALIMEAMEQLMRRRTTIMIAHRLSTLDGCDARLELEDGRPVELRLVSPLTG